MVGYSSSYCVRCRKKTKDVDSEEVETKNGRKAIRSKCGSCSTTKYRFTK
jgi:hypothetical protein